MEVKINKELRNFKEAIFFGLTLRQFICAVLAVGVSLGLYFLLNRLMGNSELGWLCVIGATPFALLGFFRFQGLPLERVAMAWLRSQVFYPRRLSFRARNERIVHLRSQKKTRRQEPRKAPKRSEKKEAAHV